MTRTDITAIVTAVILAERLAVYAIRAWQAYKARTAAAK